jgi:hypothetical protein
MALKLIAALALALAMDWHASLALAKGGGFSSGSGRSFSSGRSYSSGSHSFSSGSHSFSSGGSSPHSFSSGKSYSSGGGTRPSSGSSSPGFSSGSGGSPSRSFSSGSGGSSNPSFSSGSSSSQKGPSSPRLDGRSSPASPSAARSPGKSQLSSGRSYSSGGSPAASFPSGKSYSSDASRHPEFGTRPSHGNYDASAGALKQREASRAAYVAGQAPRSVYVDPAGQRQPINPESKVVRQLRDDLRYEQWRNREQRERQFYGSSWNGWYSARPAYYYHDPFSNLFWYWLMSQSFNTQAQWAYNHRDLMDEIRYRDLLAHDGRIEQEIRNLQQQGVPPDPTHTPQAMPSDLMYDDNYVQAVYNPQPQVARPAGAGFLHGLFRFLVIVALILGLMWLVFLKRWGGGNTLGRW